MVTTCAYFGDQQSRSGSMCIVSLLTSPPIVHIHAHTHTIQAIKAVNFQAKKELEFLVYCNSLYIMPTEYRCKGKLKT
jgi:hypothetical protein